MGHPATKIHPLTGKTLEPIWVSPSGRVFWPIMGGSPDQPPAPAPSPTPDPTPTPTPTPEPTPPAPDPDDGKGGKDAVLADLAKERDKRQGLETQLAEIQSAQQQQLDAIAKALGLKEDTPPDPAALAEQITAEQARTRQAAVQLAVYRNAAAHDANADELLDSASFLATLSDIDPTDAAAVGTAIKAAVEINPKFKATPAPPSFNGGPRTSHTKPEATPGLGRLQQAYANPSK